MKLNKSYFYLINVLTLSVNVFGGGGGQPMHKILRIPHLSDM